MSDGQDEAVTVRGRGQTYGVIAGVVAGMLIAGVLVPLLFEDTASNSSSSSAIGSPNVRGGRAESQVSGAPGSSGTPSTIAGGAQASSGSAARGGNVAGGGSAASSPTTAPTEPLRASDKGITPTTIKLGFVLLDLTTANHAGLAPPNYT